MGGIRWHVPFPNNALDEPAATVGKSPADRRRTKPLNALPRVRGLVFDMGDVLYDATLWRRWLLQLLQRLGHLYSYREFYQVWDRDYLDLVHRGKREYREAFASFLSAQ